MAYVLQALIASLHTLNSLEIRSPNSGVVSLKFGLALMPLPAPFREEIASQVPNAEVVFPDIFYYLTSPMIALAHEASVLGPVAYVEAECDGGICQQSAILWDNRDITWGPVRAGDEDHGIPLDFPRQDRPINQVLRRLGVAASGNTDEFAVVGLPRHRFTDDWLEDSKRSRAG